MQVARDRGSSGSGLRRSIERDGLDADRKEPVDLHHRNRVLKMGSSYFARSVSLQTVTQLVQEPTAEGLPAAMTCRVPEVAPSTHSELHARPPLAPCMQVEFAMELGLQMGRKRVAPPLRDADPHNFLGQRRFTPDRPDQGCCSNITRHRSARIPAVAVGA